MCEILIMASMHCKWNGDIILAGHIQMTLFICIRFECFRCCSFDCVYFGGHFGGKEFDQTNGLVVELNECLPLSEECLHSM